MPPSLESIKEAFQHLDSCPSISIGPRPHTAVKDENNVVFVYDGNGVQRFMLNIHDWPEFKKYYGLTCEDP